jgi:hypothetical protein
MTARWTGTRIGRICRDAILFGSLAGVATAIPVAKGLVTGTTDAAAIAEERDRMEEAEVEQRNQAIEVELKTLGRHPWAGAYYQGDGLGANVRLVLAPRSGIAATWNGCLGLYGANAGTVVEHPGGQLLFQFERPNAERFGGFPDSAIRVRWGERRYLVPPSKLSDFVAAINQGREPRPRAWGSFFLADGDEYKPVSGLPGLPVEYRGRIRNRALTAHVLAVEPLPDQRQFDNVCDKLYRVHLQVADRGLLRISEKLQPQVPSDAFGDVVIEDATPGSAVGVARFLEINCKKPEHVPDRDWVFSTGAFDLIAANKAIEQSAKRRTRE